jgi:hypothetical protein
VLNVTIDSLYCTIGEENGLILQTKDEKYAKAA